MPETVYANATTFCMQWRSLYLLLSVNKTSYTGKKKKTVSLSCMILLWVISDALDGNVGAVWSWRCLVVELCKNLGVV